MPPIREYICRSTECNGYVFDEIITSNDPDEYRHHTCRCGARAELLPAMIGGYLGNMGGGSTRPKNSTSMPSKKAFTGNKKAD